MTVYYYDEATKPYLGQLDRKIEDSSVLTSAAKTAYIGSTWDKAKSSEQLGVDFDTYTLTTAEETELDTIVAGLTGKPGGKGYWYKRSEGDSTDSVGSFSTKLAISRTDVPYGKYKVEWYFELEADAADTVAEARIIVDGTVEGRAIIKNGEVPASGLRIIKMGDGTHDLMIRFRRKAGTGNAIIRRARLLVFLFDKLEESST